MIKMKQTPEESPIQAIFGSHPQVKVIETLLLHPDFEYNLTELAECSEVSKATIFELKDKLVHYGIIKPTRKVGHIQLYKFNKESQIGKLLNSLSFKLAEIDIDVLLEEEKKEGTQRAKRVLKVEA